MNLSMIYDNKIKEIKKIKNSVGIFIKIYIKLIREEKLVIRIRTILFSQIKRNIKFILLFF